MPYFITNIFIAIVLAAALISPAIAESNGICNEIINKKIGKKFNISNFSSVENGGVIISSACKIWPKDNKTLISAYAYLNPGESSDGFPELNLLVTLSNNKSSQILAFHKDKAYQDSLMEISRSSLSIDTARYDLSPSVRAFGIRINSTYRVSMGHEGGLNNYLSLFIQEGYKLKPVLKELPTTYWTYANGYPFTTGKETGDETIEETEITLAIGKSVRNGLRDLEINAESFIEAGDGRKTKRRTFSHNISYTGKVYEQDAWNKAFNEWSR